jgi:hypothetical protein
MMEVHVFVPGLFRTASSRLEKNIIGDECVWGEEYVIGPNKLSH